MSLGLVGVSKQDLYGQAAIDQQVGSTGGLKVSQCAVGRGLR